MLLKLLKIADYGMKTPILYAILALHQQDPVPNAEAVLDLLLFILNKNNGPTCQDEDQKVILKTLFNIVESQFFFFFTLISVLCNDIQMDQ